MSALHQNVRSCGRYNLGCGYAVEFTLHQGRLNCVWDPTLPDGKRARQLLPQYRNARDAFLASLGINIMVVEL